MKINNSIGVVLIHGAGAGSFVWDKLRSLIEYPTLAINFPNREADDKKNNGLSFDDYLKSVVSQIENWNQTKLILITHSIGGCVGLKLADSLGTKVVGFIGISSLLPVSGQSFTDCFPSPQKYLMPLMLNVFGTKPPQKSIEHEVCNDLNTEQCAEIVRRFTPESKQLFTTKVIYRKLPTMYFYVKLSNDKAVSMSMQDKMISNLNIKTASTLDSGHMAMMSKPKELSEVLNRFITEIISNRNIELL